MSSRDGIGAVISRNLGAERLENRSYRALRRLGAVASSRDGETLSLQASRSRSTLHRWRHSIETNPPCTTLQRSISLLGRDDENLHAGLEVTFIRRHVSDNGRICGDDNFLFSTL